MDWEAGVGRAWVPVGAATAVAWVATGIVIATAVTPSPIDPAGSVGYATPLLFVGAVGDRDGLGALVAWIVGGAVLGAAVGVGAHAVLDVPINQYGLAGMGVAFGGGMGGLVNFLSVGEAEHEPEPGVRVDMGTDDAPEPRPADLFEEHPDPVLYIADEGGGPVVRAANDAYGETFELPTTTLEGAPLGDAIVPADDDGDGLVDTLAAGESVDRDLQFRRGDGVATFRVRSIGDPADGYLLFTPRED